MPAKDVYHETCKNALIKDGWTVTHDPLFLYWNERKSYVDLGAEKTLAAEKSGRKIAVEIKSFLGPSEMFDLEQALGQFILYRLAMQREHPDRELYLAIPETVYLSLFTEPDGTDLIEVADLRMIVFDPDSEEIRLWVP